MKKIIFMVIAFMAFLGSTHALSIFVVDEDNNKILYEDHLIGGKYAFLIGNDESDKVKLNNLAYVSRLRNDLTYRATIQMLILEESNNKDYYLSDGINVIDTKDNEELINKYLESYENKVSCDNKTYDVGYKEVLYIDCGVSILSYNRDNPNISLSNDNKLIANAGGVQVINFTHDSLAIYDNYIYANSIFDDEFSITLNVVANKIELNIVTPDNHDFRFNYGIFNEDGELIEKMDLNTGYNEIYFAKGTNIYLKELTEYSIYLLDDDKYFLDSSDTYKVDVIKEAREFNVNINTYDRDMYYDDSFVSTYTDVTIYDKNYNYYTTLKCDGSCKINLKSGTYIFEDNVSKFRELWVIENNMDVNMYRYLLNGIMCDEDISSIKKDNEDIGFTKNGIFYIFDEVMTSGIYNVVINDKEYSVNLSNYNNYTYIRNIGTLYELKIDIDNSDSDEIIGDIVIDIGNNEDININIPDTYVSILESDKYVLFKKKRYCYFSNSNSYIN